jgi:hypothetical protein
MVTLKAVYLFSTRAVQSQDTSPFFAVNFNDSRKMGSQFTNLFARIEDHSRTRVPK